MKLKSMPSLLSKGNNFALPFYFSIFGFFLIVLSMILGNGTLKLTNDSSSNSLYKQVGFVFSFNWSVTALFIWPLMIYITLSIFRSAEAICKEFSSSKISRDVSSSKTLLSQWNRKQLDLGAMISISLFVSFVISLSEWYSFSMQPILYRTGAGMHELDWSSVQIKGVSPYFILFFSLMCWLYQAIAISCILTVFSIMVTLARVIIEMRDQPIQIDFTSIDSKNRGGFGLFEPILESIIVFLSICYINFFLSKAQNEYIRNPSCLDDAISCIVASLPESISDTESYQLAKLFYTGKDFTSMSVTFGVISLVLVAFSLLNISVRQIARAALANTAKDFQTMTEEEFQEKYQLSVSEARIFLTNINIWPLGWGKIRDYTAIVLSATIALVYIRLSIFVILFGLLFGSIKSLFFASK